MKYGKMTLRKIQALTEFNPCSSETRNQNVICLKSCSLKKYLRNLSEEKLKNDVGGRVKNCCNVFLFS